MYNQTMKIHKYLSLNLYAFGVVIIQIIAFTVYLWIDYLTDSYWENNLAYHTTITLWLIIFDLPIYSPLLFLYFIIELILQKLNKKIPKIEFKTKLGNIAHAILFYIFILLSSYISLILHILKKLPPIPD